MENPMISVVSSLISRISPIVRDCNINLEQATRFRHFGGHFEASDYLVV
jgi:hypothetical protein